MLAALQLASTKPNFYCAGHCTNIYKLHFLELCVTETISHSVHIEVELHPAESRGAVSLISIEVKFLSHKLNHKKLADLFP